MKTLLPGNFITIAGNVYWPLDGVLSANQREIPQEHIGNGNTYGFR